MNKMIISPRFVRYLVLRPSFLRGSRRPWRSLPVFCLSNDAYMSLARPRRRLNTSQRKAGVVKCQWKGEKHGTFADFCVYIYIIYTYAWSFTSCINFMFVLFCSSMSHWNRYKPWEVAASGTFTPLVSIVLAQLASLSLAERVHGLFEAQPLPSTCHDGVLQLDGRPAGGETTQKLRLKAVSKIFLYHKWVI